MQDILYVTSVKGLFGLRTTNVLVYFGLPAEITVRCVQEEMGVGA